MAIFSIPLCDLLLHLGVLEFQPVFQIIYIDNAGNGNAVFFQNETLLVEVRPACDLSQIDAGFGQWNAVYHRHCFFHDGPPLFNIDSRKLIRENIYDYPKDKIVFMFRTFAILPVPLTGAKNV